MSQPQLIMSPCSQITDRPYRITRDFSSTSPSCADTVRGAGECRSAGLTIVAVASPCRPGAYARDSVGVSSTSVVSSFSSSLAMPMTSPTAGGGRARRREDAFAGKPLPSSKVSVAVGTLTSRAYAPVDEVSESSLLDGKFYHECVEFVS